MSVLTTRTHHVTKTAVASESRLQLQPLDTVGLRAASRWRDPHSGRWWFVKRAPRHYIEREVRATQVAYALGLGGSVLPVRRLAAEMIATPWLEACVPLAATRYAARVCRAQAANGDHHLLVLALFEWLLDDDDRSWNNAIVVPDATQSGGGRLLLIDFENAWGAHGHNHQWQALNASAVRDAAYPTRRAHDAARVPWSVWRHVAHREQALRRLSRGMRHADALDHRLRVVRHAARRAEQRDTVTLGDLRALCSDGRGVDEEMMGADRSDPKDRRAD